MRTSTRIAHDPIFSSFLPNPLGPLPARSLSSKRVELVGKVGFLFFRGKSGVAFKQNGNLGKGVNSHFLNSKVRTESRLAQKHRARDPTAFLSKALRSRKADDKAEGIESIPVEAVESREIKTISFFPTRTFTNQTEVPGRQGNRREIRQNLLAWKAFPHRETGFFFPFWSEKAKSPGPCLSRPKNGKTFGIDRILPGRVHPFRICERNAGSKTSQSPQEGSFSLGRLAR